MAFKASSLARFAFLSLAFLAACMQSPRAPSVSPRGVLAPEAREGAAFSDKGPFAVVFGGPQGKAEAASEIPIIFNRPMRPLELAGDESAPPVRMSPAVAGHWQWVGTSALKFVPEGHLPHATEFHIEIPAGTRSLDGEALGQDYRQSFSTPPPSIVKVSPYTHDTLEPSSAFTVQFNQPVSDMEIRRAISLIAGRRNISFDIRRPEPKNQRLALLVPQSKLPTDSVIVLQKAGDLRGSEGPLVSNEEQRFEFRTYGPLRLTGVACDTDTPHGRCSPNGGLALELTNPVRFADLKRAIRIEPPVPMSFPDWPDDELLDYAWLRAKLVPGTRYQLELLADLPGGGKLVDRYGQALAHDMKQSVVVDDYWPEVEIGLAGSYLEPSRSRDIPIFSVNTDYEIVVSKLDIDHVLELTASDPGRASAIKRLASATGAKPRKIRPRLPKNQTATEVLSADQILGSSKARGPFGVAISYRTGPERGEDRSRSELKIVQLTDVGITAKVSAGGALVFVTRLSTGEPIANASVEIRSTTHSSGVYRTDADGIATIPEERFHATRDTLATSIIFVRDGEDLAYRRVMETLNPYQFGVEASYSLQEPAIGMIFTDRGIYRRGDIAKVKGIVREPKGPKVITPKGRKLTLSLHDPYGEKVWDEELVLNEFGSFDVDIRVPQTGRIGGYHLTATMEGSDRFWGDFSGSFEVAEYRPAEFEVKVDSDKASYIRGERAKFGGQGDFLYGAPMSDAKARYTVTRAPAYFRVPSLPVGFESSDSAYLAGLTEAAPESNLILSGEANLDNRGEIEVATSLALPGQRGPERVSCEVEVTDISRQSVAGSKTTIVHPGEFYIALRDDKEGFAEAKKPVKVEALAASPSGVRKANIKVRVDLIHRTWTLARQATGGASLHSVVEPVDKIVDGCDLQTRSDAVSCELTPPSGGYYLVRARAKDTRGHELFSSIDFYAIGEGAGGFGDNDQLRVDLVADKDSYQVGDTARILVKSPFKEADALVTVERAGIFSHERIHLSGMTPTISVPITEEMRPNAFVSVMILRGRTKEAPASAKEPDLGAPAFRLGYASLNVDGSSRRFQVKVEPNRKEFSPGENVEVAIDIRNHEGKGERAEVTLYAVDEGVLSLVGYQTPDPLPVFNAKRSLRVLNIESREDLARFIGRDSLVHGLEKGDEGGGGADGVRRDFRQTVYFNPSVITDAKGQAKVSFELPDNLTTYRIMAVVVGEEDRFGFGEERIVASKKLMARPAFPRFLRAGDTIDAGIVLSSKGLADADIEVRAKADGLELRSSPKQKIRLHRDSSEEVRFSFRADRATEAKITFHIEGGGEKDAVEIRRQVKSPAVVEAVALYGDTRTAAGEALGDFSALRSDVGQLEIALSSTALVGLGAGMDQLIEYPYECIEQQTSRLVPLVALRELAKEYAITLPANADTIIQSTVGKIVAAQRNDGGFGFWADSPRSNPWVTAYALWGLGEAKRLGVEISDRSIERATYYLRRQLETWEKTSMGPATAAFIVDVFAMNGSPDPGWQSRLFEAREKLPVFGRALLAHAMATTKSDREALAELERELKNHIRLDGPVAKVVTHTGNEYAALMDSETRTNALVLRALVAMSPESPLIVPLAKGLLQSRQGGTWRSTQETAWALLALDDYRRARESSEPAFDARVFLGQNLLFSTTFEDRKTRGAHRSIPASEFVAKDGSTLAFEVLGEGTLFYETRLQYARKELPRAPLDRGFFVQHTLRSVRPEELAEAMKRVPEKGLASFQGGDLILGDLIILSPSPRDHVVIEAPLPAGFEAVDAKLKTTAQSLDIPGSTYDYGYGYDEYDGVGYGAYDGPLASWFHKEVYDDKVAFFVEHMGAGLYHYRYLARATTLGSFIAPPATAYEMYAPEVFGRTAAETIEVRAR